MVASGREGGTQQKVGSLLTFTCNTLFTYASSIRLYNLQEAETFATTTFTHNAVH